VTVYPSTEPQLRDIELAAVLAALSDPVRLHIATELERRGEVQCGDFQVGVARSTLSHHLKVLREAGVTNTRVAGAERFVRLRTEDLEARFPGLLPAGLAGAGAKRRRAR
jgi:DNA-binding transcriptional ArsR family regulator